MSFSINLTGGYNAGTHDVSVSGEFEAAKWRRARPPAIQKTLLFRRFAPVRDRGTCAGVHNG